MALTICRECEAQVSTAAKSCPHCGAKGNALTGRIGPMGMLGYGLVILFGAGVIVGVINDRQKPPTADDKAEQSVAAKQAVNIANYAKSLKASARNPDSVVFDRVFANKDGTLVCFKYRAQNGFGGTNRETVAFSPAGGAQDSFTVRAVCRDKVMKDVTDEAIPNIKLMG